jgi:hypothetical protein
MDARLIWNEITGRFETNIGVGARDPFVTQGQQQTLTNKTLTAPTLTDVTLSGTSTIGAGATLTTPALVSPVITHPRTEYLADGAIATTTHQAVLTSTDAGAYTLATVATDGIVIDLINTTSFAHVITGTNLFWAGQVNGPFNKVTTAAFPGFCGRLISQGGLWLVMSSGLGALTVGD